MKKLLIFLLLIFLISNVEAKQYYGYLVTKIPAPVYDVVINVNQVTQTSFRDYSIANCNFNINDGFWHCKGDGKDFNIIMIAENDKPNKYNIGIIYYQAKKLSSTPRLDGQPTSEDITNMANKRNLEFHNIDIRNVSGERKFLYKETEDIKMINIIFIIAIILLILFAAVFFAIRWFKKDDYSNTTNELKTKETESIDNIPKTNIQEEIEKLMKDL